MAEKNKLKTTKMGGKGGDIFSLRHKSGLFYFIAFVLIFLISFQPVAFAARSSAGGGKIAKPDWGKVATNVGISIGAAIVVPALISGIQAAGPAAAGAQTGAQVGTQVGTQAMTMGDFAVAADAWLAEPLSFTATESASSSLFTTVGNTLGAIGTGAKSAVITGTNFVTNTAGGGVTVTNAAGTVTAVRPLAAMGNSLGQGINLANVVTGYSTFVATSQVNRAVGMAGAYYDWKPSNTFIISSFATGATAGLLDPSIALGDALPKNAANQTVLGVSTPMMLKGAFIGGIGGLASAGAIVAIDGKKINKGKSPGVTAQIAGMVAGQVGAQFGRDLFNYDTWHKKDGTIVEVRDPLEVARDDHKFQDLERIDKGNAEAVIKSEERITQAANMDPAYRQLKSLDKAIDESIPTFTSVFGESDLAENYKYAKYSEYGDPNAHFTNEAEKYMHEYYGNKHTYIPILGENGGKRTPGAPIPDYKFQPAHNDYKPREIVKDVYEFYSYSKENLPIGTVMGRLTKGVFVDTFSAQNWPLLAARSLGIYATSRLSEDKQYLAPLVNSLAVSVSHPVFSSLANVYGIDASRYFGSKFDKLEANLKYAYNLNFIAGNNRNAENNLKMNKLTKELGNNPSPKRLEQYATALADLSIEKDKEGKGVPYDFQGEKDPIAMRNRARFQEKTRLEEKFMSLDKYTNDEALKNIHTNKLEVLGSQIWAGARSGIFEGLISGGVETVFEKNTKNSDPTQKMLLSYAANMSTAALRGVAWHLGWQRVTDSYPWRKDSWDYVMPESYAGDDWLQAKLDTYPEAKLAFDRFKGNLETEPITRKQSIGDPDTGENKPWKMITLITEDEKPSLPIALEASLAQANTEWANNALTFGRPLTHYRGEAGFGIEPQQVSALRFMDYASSLRNLSSIYNQQGLASVIAYSFTQANKDTIANNISGVALQVPGVTDIFNMQPERLVLLKTLNKELKEVGISKLPYSIQRLSFSDLQTITWVPFTNPLYGSRPQIGEGAYLQLKGLPENGNENLAPNLNK